MTADELGAGRGEPDSEGCLLVVAGYADIAAVLGPVTAEAAASIMRSSPELGDFFDLRFADIGPRPGSPSGRADAIAHIAGELTRPAGAAGRHYFALVVADRSAAVAEQLLAECRAHPVIAGLPMRCRGLASTDDRRPGTGEAAAGSPAANIVFPAAGAWDRASLVHELRSFAAELLTDFAAGNEPALTPGQVSQLLSAEEQNPAEEQAHGPAMDDQAPGPQPAPSPDALSPPRDEPHPQLPERAPVLWRPAVPDAGRRPRRLPALWRARHADEPAVGRPAAAAEVQPHDPAMDDQAPGPQPAPSPDALSPLRDERHPQLPERAPVLWRPAVPGAGRRPRRLPALWRARHADEPAVGRPAAAAEVQPRPACVALLILIGDEDTDDEGTWRRGRSVLLEIDKNLAAAPQADYRVRVLRSTGDAAMSEPRYAGKLTRRDIRRPTASLDFPRVLGIIRTAVKRGRAAGGITSSPATRPTIVFFAADVPLADAVTARLYSELAREASIMWIVPEQLADLLSPAFREEGEWVVNDHRAVAGEVMTLLHNTESTTETTGADEAITEDEWSAG